MPCHIAPPNGVNVRAVSIHPVIVFVVPAIKMNLLKGVQGFIIVAITISLSLHQNMGKQLSEAEIEMVLITPSAETIF